MPVDCSRSRLFMDLTLVTQNSSKERELFTFGMDTHCKSVRKVNVSNKIFYKKGDLVSKSRTEFQVVCSWCGGLIRGNASADEEQMCLICHARMLNNYLRDLRKRSDEKRRRLGVASE